MKAISLSLLLVALSYSTFAQEQGIKFELGSSWKKVLAEANREKKFVFVDCYASWCAPCKSMDQRTYPNEKVGDFFNKNFICVRLQMDTSANDDAGIKTNYGDAQVLKHQFRVEAFPTFLFFSPDGKAVHRGLGFQDTSRLIKLGEDALVPNRQYYTLLSRYENGKLLTAEEYTGLARMANHFDGDSLAHKIANDYINSLSERDLMTPENLEFMYNFTRTSKDRGFILCKDSAEAIAKVFPRMSVEVSHGIVARVLFEEDIKPFETADRGMPDWEKMKANLMPYGDLGAKSLEMYRPQLVFKSVINPAMGEDPDWTGVLDLIRRQELGEGEKYLVGAAIVFYERQLDHGVSTDCRNLIAACIYYNEHFPDVARAPQKNEFAYTVFQHDMNEDDLKLALGWSKFAVDSADADDRSKADYLDTYSNLLYKLGQKDQAILWEQKAIETRPGDKALRKALERMQSGKPTW